MDHLSESGSSEERGKEVAWNLAPKELHILFSK